MTLDPRAYAQARVAAQGRPSLSPAELRPRLAALLGGLDAWERPPLEARVTDTQQLDGYRREAVEFTTRPGLAAFGYMLTPDDLSAGERRPAVLCLPGHGRGVDSIIGIAADGSQRKMSAWDEYQADFALQCVFHGYPTFALEQISFGHRRGPAAMKEGGGASSCQDDSMAALMLGETMTGWRVWDAMRALDYLQTRPEVDGARLATMGISGGGLTSLFTGALDERVTVCVVSGYLNTFADSVLSIHHCVDNYAPGLSALCEMADVAGLVAPRALYAESGSRDPIFPLTAFQATAREVASRYAAAGVPDRFAWDVFDGEHRWDGAGVWPFLERVFGGG
jgi:hypothetical protein